MKALYYGDNLQVLRDSIATESVDLIYLDLPFNSNATYNLGYRGKAVVIGCVAEPPLVAISENWSAAPADTRCPGRST